MNSPYDVIKTLITTEKSNLYQPKGKYLFLVDKKSNKIQIKRAVEDIYKVKVADVNVFVTHGKMRKVRYQLGKTPDLKKAVVTLKKGQKIESSS
ncbi:MAG: 50S ribosomal protein L23 [Candidatus Omnitrophota bacterium]